MLFIFPKRKISIFDYEGRNAKRISNFRRFEHLSSNYLVMFLLSICLLAFSARIGSLLLFCFSDFTEDDLAYALIGIDLPNSKSQEFIQNKRLCVYLTIESDGNIKIDGERIAPGNLYQELVYHRMELPNLFINIVADKDCKMELVLNVLSQCRKASARRIFFLTNKYSPV